MKNGTEYEHVIPKGWNSLVIVYDGKVKIQDSETILGAHCCAQFKLNDKTDEVIKIKSIDEGTKLIMVAGKPLREPIAKYGPFVLNEQAELQKAVDDFHQGKNGFEGAK